MTIIYNTCFRTSQKTVSIIEKRRTHMHRSSCDVSVVLARYEPKSELTRFSKNPVRWELHFSTGKDGQTRRVT
jgi:hypothetical protein